MKILDLKPRPELEQVKKWHKKYEELAKLMNELRKRDLPPDLVSSINQGIAFLNNFLGSNQSLLKQVRTVELRILKLIEKELKLVPKNSYRTRWMVIGMSAFGVPIGMAFGAGLGNMAFLAIGIPFGMSIGIAIGTLMDKKALEEGRQLDIEIKAL